MLDAAVHALLKEKLADTEYPVEIEGKKVLFLDWIVGLEEKAGAASKIQDSNKDLVRQRDEWEASKKVLDAEILALKEKTTKFDKKGMNDEAEARLNAAIKAADEAKESIRILTEQITKEKLQTQNAKVESERNSLQKDLIEKLGGKKIYNENAKLALNTLLSEGYVTVVQKEDGSIERQFRLFDANRRPLAATLDEVVTSFATSHPNLAAGPGPKGTQGAAGSTGATGDFTPPAATAASFAGMVRSNSPTP